MKEQLIYHYFNNVEPLKKLRLHRGIFLVLLNSIYTPPHLELIIHGKVYDISVSGIRVAMPVELLVKFIDKRQLPTLFIQIAVDGDVLSDLEQAAEDIYNRFSRVDEQVTCLEPIKLFLSSVLHETEYTQARHIFDVIDMLTQQNVLQQSYALWMEDVIQDGVFSMKKYSVNHIKEEIVRRSIKIC